MPLDVVETLRALIRLPSVNPMGRSDEGDIFYEGRVTDYLQELANRLGLPWERHPVHPRRDNIFIRLDGGVPPEEGGRLLLWEVHQDTVPIDGMIVPPFGAELRDGRVYGRGACDIKGSMACMLAALSRLQGLPRGERPTIVLACTINEEHGFTGATHLAHVALRGSSKLLPRLPDACLVAEPTELQVVVAHKGVVRWRCHTYGRAAHSSAPERGSNAIYKMARVVEQLERYALEVVGALAEHPLLGRPTLSVGTIQGGISVNTVPDACVIEIDRRVHPGEDPLAAQKHVIDFVAEEAHAIDPIEHEKPMIISPGLSDAKNGALAAVLQGAVQSCGLACERIGVPFGTDAAPLAAIGMPSVVFGPGSIRQAHTEDEWIAVDALQQATDCLVAFARRW